MIDQSRTKLHHSSMSAAIMLLLSACGGSGGSSTDAAPSSEQAAAEVTWSQCATEGGSCSFSGTRAVRYGTSAQYNTLTVSNGVACNNQVFGDPAVGELKACWVAGNGSAPAPSPSPPAASNSGSAGPRVSSFTSSGPIVASTGQIIAGVRIQNSGGP